MMSDMKKSDDIHFCFSPLNNQEPFADEGPSVNDPTMGWGALDTKTPLPSWKMINLHFGGTLYLSIKIFKDYNVAKIIAEANKNVDTYREFLDWIATPSSKRECAIAHYIADNTISLEALREMSLKHYRDALKASCWLQRNGCIEEGDKKIGEALHTLQDSYSHSDNNGMPIRAKEHELKKDSLQTNSLRAGLALEETDTLLRKYFDLRNEKQTITVAKEKCEHCSFWQEQVLFGMEKSLSGKRACEE